MVNGIIGNRGSGAVQSSIISPLTVNVPADFATLQAAMDWIELQILLAELTIQIADGTYVHTAGVGHTFEHPNYNMVNILGNVGTPANVAMNFSGGALAFLVLRYGLKSVSGLKASGGGYGFYANQGGSIFDLTIVEVTTMANFGVISHDGGYLYADTVNSNNNGHGFAAYGTGFLKCIDGTSQNNTGWGFLADAGGIIRLAGATTVSGNGSGSYSPGLEVQTAKGALITAT